MNARHVPMIAKLTRSAKIFPEHPRAFATLVIPGILYKDVQVGNHHIFDDVTHIDLKRIVYKFAKD